MKYRVRNEDGEVEFESYAELLEAASAGLVEASDEVKREDEAAWRKASALPGLLRATSGGPRFWHSPYFRWIFLSLVGAVFAGWAIHTGRTQHRWELLATGLVVVFVLAGVLFKITADASKPRR
ncbi:MAG: hypothetical protein ACOZQL_38560 [Myxococcota bacterium]